MPWKLPRTLAGSPMPRIAPSMASVACDSEAPGAWLKLTVVAGAPLWWLTASGVFVLSQCASVASGTCAPSAPGS